MRRVPRDVLVCLYRWRAGAPELLMLRRAPDRGDFWHWISGAPQPGETDREAAIREVLEETGLDVAATIFALGYRYAYPLRPERRERWLELYGPAITRIPVETFSAEAPVRWQPTLDDEHDAYSWCTFSEAERRLSWPGDPGTLDHLRATLAVLRGALLDDRTLPARPRRRTFRSPGQAPRARPRHTITPARTDNRGPAPS